MTPAKKRSKPSENILKEITPAPRGKVALDALAKVCDRLGWKYHILHSAPDNTRIDLKLVRSYDVLGLSELHLASGEPDLTIDWGGKLVEINYNNSKLNLDFLGSLRREIRAGGLFVQPTHQEIAEENLKLLEDWQAAAGLFRETTNFAKREWSLNVNADQFALLVPLIEGDKTEEGIFAVHLEIDTQGDRLQISLRDIDDVGIGLLDGVDLAKGIMLLRMGLILDSDAPKQIDPERKRFVEWFEQWLHEHKLIRDEMPAEAKQFKGGRPRNEDDEWAYKQVRMHGRKPEVVYKEWLERIGERAGTLADPRDSFNKAIRPRRNAEKTGKNIEKTE